MKKILFTAVSALALAAFADGVNSTEFGVLTVPSSAEETIISVPWLASGTGSDAVKVCDLVLTAGLNAATPPATNGDTLKYYNGSTWLAWVLTDDGSGKKSWQPSTTTGATADTTVVRGRALLLKRPNAERADKFYIMGKPTTASGFVELNQGYTLIAPPFATATDVNSLTWTTGAAISSTKDSLMVPTGDAKGSFVTLSYVGNPKKWKKWTGSAWQEGYTIPAGMGAWFVNGESSVKKVSW